MAAHVITKSIAPRMEFYAPSGGGVRVRVFDSLNNVEWECDITADTWAALDTAMDTPTTEYIPKNEGPGIHNSDGRLSSGGERPVGDWAGA